MRAKARSDHVRRKYEFIKAHRKQFPVDVMCRARRRAQWLLRVAEMPTVQARH